MTIFRFVVYKVKFHWLQDDTYGTDIILTPYVFDVYLLADFSTFQLELDTEEKFKIPMTEKGIVDSAFSVSFFMTKTLHLDIIQICHQL
jgi:hypothetical protein